MGIIGYFTQQCREFGVGRSDRGDRIAAAVAEFLFCGGEAFAVDDIPDNVFPQGGFHGLLLGCRRENAPCVAEYSEQVHGAFHADARGHLQGDILDGHNRKMSFIIL